MGSYLNINVAPPVAMGMATYIAGARMVAVIASAASSPRLKRAPVTPDAIRASVCLKTQQSSYDLTEKVLGPSRFMIRLTCEHEFSRFQRQPSDPRTLAPNL